MCSGNNQVGPPDIFPPIQSLLIRYRFLEINSYVLPVGKQTLESTVGTKDKGQTHALALHVREE